MSRAIPRAILVGLLVGTVLFGMFYAVNAISLEQPVATMTAHVRQAYRQRALDNDDYKPDDTRVGQHQYNDCLILAMAIDHRAPDRELRVSPAHAFSHMNDGMCQQLWDVVRSGYGARPIVLYHNYIHGQTALTRFLLPRLQLEEIRKLYKNIGMILVGLGLIVGLFQLAKGRWQGAFWAVFFFVFARWFGLESFAQSLGHGPSDIVFLGCAAGLALASARGGAPERSLILSAAVFGGSTMIFELLTGGTPLGLALLVGGVPFASADDVRIGRTVILGVTAYCSAIVACYAAKLMLVAGTLGWASVLAVGHQGAQRVAGVPSTEAAIPLGIDIWASRIVENMTGLATGMTLLTVLVLETAIVAGVWGVLTLRRQGVGRQNAHLVCLILSNGPIVLWMAVFAQHTIVHAWFMDRMFAWTIVTGLTVFAMAVVKTNGARWMETVAAMGGGSNEAPTRHAPKVGTIKSPETDVAASQFIA